VLLDRPRDLAIPARVRDPRGTVHELEEAHRELKISPAIFDEVAAELGRSLDHFNVPEPEKGEVLAAFAAHKGEVTEGYSG
jgi:hemoglobin